MYILLHGNIPGRRADLGKVIIVHLQCKGFKLSVSQKRRNNILYSHVYVLGCAEHICIILYMYITPEQRIPSFKFPVCMCRRQRILAKLHVASVCNLKKRMHVNLPPITHAGV